MPCALLCHLEAVVLADPRKLKCTGEFQTTIPRCEEPWVPTGTSTFSSWPNTGPPELGEQQAFRGLEMDVHHQQSSGSAWNKLQLPSASRAGTNPDGYSQIIALDQMLQFILQLGMTSLQNHSIVTSHSKNCHSTAVLKSSSNLLMRGEHLTFFFFFHPTISYSEWIFYQTYLSPTLSEAETYFLALCNWLKHLLFWSTIQFNGILDYRIC